MAKFAWDTHGAVCLAQQSVAWLHALKDRRPEMGAAFVDWLMESPRHLREFLLMTALDRELSRLDPAHAIDVDKILREIDRTVVIFPADDYVSASKKRANLAHRRELNMAAPRSPLRRLRVASVWKLLGAACVLCLLLSFDAYTSSKVYATDVGERRTISLNDGTVVRLNTDSRLEVHFSPHAREVRLLAGEALFEVHHESARRFFVISGATRVESLGTIYSVRQNRNGVGVVVFEGKVRVSTIGQHRSEPIHAPAMTAVVVADGRIELSRMTHDELARARAWTAGRLSFRGATLQEIVDEFNRYRHVPIVVDDPTLGQQRFGGQFRVEDSNEFLSALALQWPLKITSTPHAIHIRPTP